MMKHLALLFLSISSISLSIPSLQVNSPQGEIAITEHSLGEYRLDLKTTSILVEATERLSFRLVQQGDGHVIIFTGPPGEHWLRVYYLEDGAIKVSRIKVTIQPADQPPKPNPKPDPKPDPKPEKPKDRAASVVKMRTAYSLCSATIISQTGEHVVLVSAAHCVAREGQVFDIETTSGIRFQAGVYSIDRRSDLSILKGVCFEKLVPAPLATRYTQGEPVYHCGFGRHLPGNIEEGTLRSVGEYQNTYYLSVSPGDSGGGIFNASGEWMGAVCCTTDLDRPGTVWAGNIFALKTLMGKTRKQVDLGTKQSIVKRYIIKYIASRIYLLNEDGEVIIDREILSDYVISVIGDDFLDDLAEYVVSGGCLDFAIDLAMRFLRDEHCGCRP